MISSVSTKLLGITAASVERYLSLKGWVRDHNFRNRNMMVFDYLEPKRRIAVPASETYDDFYVNLNETLCTISVFEQRSVDDIIKDMLTIFFDRMEFRIVSTLSRDGKLPLDYAANCIEGLKDLILYSACAEQKAQPVCRRTSNTAKDYLDCFNLAQTEIGSFVINIDTQVIDEQDEQLRLKNSPVIFPPEHKIITRIYTAISQIYEAVEQNQKPNEVASNAYETGMTANMCEALMKLKPLNDNAEIHATIRYASALTQSFDNNNPIVFGEHHFYVIDELAKIYRDEYLCQDVVLTGLVKSLSKGDDERTIKLSTHFEGRYRAIRMELSDENYRVACDAHRDDREVEVAGELDMSLPRWQLTKIEYFKMV